MNINLLYHEKFMQSVPKNNSEETILLCYYETAVLILVMNFKKCRFIIYTWAWCWNFYSCWFFCITREALLNAHEVFDGVWILAMLKLWFLFLL